MATAAGRITTNKLTAGMWLVTDENGVQTNRKTGPVRQVAEMTAELFRSNHARKATRVYTVTFTDSTKAGASPASTWTLASEKQIAAATAEPTTEGTTTMSDTTSTSAPAKKTTARKPAAKTTSTGRKIAAVPAKATKAAPAKAAKPAPDAKALSQLQDAQAAFDAATKALAAAKATRDKLVIKANEGGHSFAAIGAVIGLSPVRANRIASEVKGK